MCIIKEEEEGWRRIIVLRRGCLEPQTTWRQRRLMPWGNCLSCLVGQEGDAIPSQLTLHFSLDEVGGFPTPCPPSLDQRRGLRGQYLSQWVAGARHMVDLRLHPPHWRHYPPPFIIIRRRKNGRRNKMIYQASL